MNYRSDRRRKNTDYDWSRANVTYMLCLRPVVRFTGAPIDVRISQANLARSLHLVAANLSSHDAWLPFTRITHHAA
jgi:hypothetical protein